MNVDDVTPGQVFKDNDQPHRIQYPYIHILAVNPKTGKAKVRRTKDIDGKVAPRDIRTTVSLHRLVGYAYSLVVSPKVVAGTPAEAPAPVKDEIKTLA